MQNSNRPAFTKDRLKEAMEKAGIKQVELAELTGLSKSAISRYLSGEYEPKQVPIYKMAKALDVSEAWLWGYDVPMERPIEQKENDELADLVEHIKKDREFRQLIMKIDRMTPKQVESIKNLLSVFDKSGGDYDE